ncbi:arsenate reductase ArsC [Ferrimonas sp.]|uniref:arsenate reductase ArsC n=1 Tax=Ferrimonas sp. TaxID=2080861 RepID=UPI003A90F36C
MTRRILFLCRNNATRSQMAQALLQHYADGRFEAFSAGGEPEPIDPRTLTELKRHDLPVDGLRSKSIDEFDGQSFDAVISLCNKSAVHHSRFPQVEELLEWDCPDPAQEEGMTGFERCFDELSERIRTLVRVWGRVY